MRNIYMNRMGINLYLDSLIHHRRSEVLFIEDTPFIDNSVFIISTQYIPKIHELISDERLKELAKLSDGHILFLEPFTLLLEETKNYVVELVRTHNFKPQHIWFCLPWSHQKTQFTQELLNEGIEGVNMYVFNPYQASTYGQYIQNLDFFEETYKIQSTKKFSCFTRRYDDGRLNFFCRLIAEGLINQTEYTFTNLSVEVRPYPNVWITIDELKNHEIVSSYALDKQSLIKSWLDKVPYVDDTNKLDDAYSLDLYKKIMLGHINIVFETQILNRYYPNITTTEKTWKAVICKKPFILLAPSGSLKLLQNEGFETFGSNFDESYNEVDIVDSKISMIITLLKNLHQMSDAEFKTLLDEFDAKINHNLVHFLSQGKMMDEQYNALYRDLDLI